MIDREARDCLAEATRHFAVGLSTNFEFDDTAFSLRTTDRGVLEIRQELWSIYDDLREHELKGEWNLSEKQRKVVARIVMFLKSDFEYKWPVVPTWYRLLRPLLWIPTIGIGTKALDDKYRVRLDMEIWPFSSSEEIQSARTTPTYLANPA